MKDYSIRSSELCVLEVMWTADRPLSQLEILELITDQQIKNRTSIYKMLNKLLDKELIEVAGMIRNAKNYSRTFIPKISADEYTMYKLRSFSGRTGINPKIAGRLVSALMSESDIPEDILVTIEDNIAKRRKKREKGKDR